MRPRVRHSTPDSTPRSLAVLGPMPKAAGASVTKSGKGSADLGYWLVGPRGNHRLLTPCTPLRVTPRDRVDDQYIPWECIARLEPIFSNPALAALMSPQVSSLFLVCCPQGNLIVSDSSIVCRCCCIPPTVPLPERRAAYEQAHWQPVHRGPSGPGRPGTTPYADVRTTRAGSSQSHPSAPLGPCVLGSAIVLQIVLPDHLQSSVLCPRLRVPVQWVKSLKESVCVCVCAAAGGGHIVT